MANSLTIRELTEILSEMPQDFVVYTSRDSEQNGYNTINKETISISGEDKIVILGAFDDSLTEYDVYPKLMNIIEKELK